MKTRSVGGAGKIEAAQDSAFQKSQQRRAYLNFLAEKSGSVSLSRDSTHRLNLSDTAKAKKEQSASWRFRVRMYLLVDLLQRVGAC